MKNLKVFGVCRVEVLRGGVLENGVYWSYGGDMSCGMVFVFYFFYVWVLFGLLFFVDLGIG